MQRASPVDLRKSLEAANMLAQIGIRHPHFGDKDLEVFAIQIAPRDQWTHDPALPHKKT